MVGGALAHWVVDLERDSYCEADARQVGKNTWESGWDMAALWYACGGRIKFGVARLEPKHRSGPRGVQGPHRDLAWDIHENH